ncbi:MAG: hypothetical protein ABIP92_01775, partial [Arthrobacter sp.]
AIVVIGGLVSSTALTLVLVPVLYRLVEGRRERKALARTTPGSDAGTDAGTDAGPAHGRRAAPGAGPDESPAATAGGPRLPSTAP